MIFHSNDGPKHIQELKLVINVPADVQTIDSVILSDVIVLAT